VWFFQHEAMSKTECSQGGVGGLGSWPGTTPRWVPQIDPTICSRWVDDHGAALEVPWGCRVGRYKASSCPRAVDSRHASCSTSGRIQALNSPLDEGSRLVLGKVSRASARLRTDSPGCAGEMYYACTYIVRRKSEQRYESLGG